MKTRPTGQSFFISIWYWKESFYMWSLGVHLGVLILLHSLSSMCSNHHNRMLPSILRDPILRPRPISISASPGTVKWWFELIFLWIMVMFMFFCIFLYCRMYNYMYLCTNKSKNMTKITIKFISPIFQLATSTNFMQNCREHWKLCSIQPANSRNTSSPSHLLISH